MSPVGFCCKSDPVDNHVVPKTKNHSGIHRYVEKYVLHLVLMCSDGLFFIELLTLNSYFFKFIFMERLSRKTAKITSPYPERIIQFGEGNF